MPTTPKVVTFAIIKSRKSYTTTQKVGTRHAVSERAKRDPNVGTFGSSVRMSKASQNRHAVSAPDPIGVAQPHTKPPPLNSLFLSSQCQP